MTDVKMKLHLCKEPDKLIREQSVSEQRKKQLTIY